MGTARRFDLDHRLEAYFATLRASSVKEALKRSAANWQIYAAVTGSAMAMVTSASASIISNGTRDVTGEPVASVLAAKHHLTSFRGTFPAFMTAERTTMAYGWRVYGLGMIAVGMACLVFGYFDPGQSVPDRLRRIPGTAISKEQIQRVS